MQEQPIRIAQIMGKMVSGGVESVVMNYYKNIDHSKIQFDFFIDDDSTHVPEEEIKKMGGKIYYLPPYQHVFRYMRCLKEIFVENKYKIVHSHLNSLSVFPLRSAKKASVPIRIAHSHSTSTKDKREWIKNLIKNTLKLFSRVYATHYFACTKYAGEWLFGKKNIKNNKVTIINNAINTKIFEPNNEFREEIRKKLSIEDKFVIGHVGRFMHQKNHSFLIDVFNAVYEKEKSSVLLLIGDGPLKEDIIQKVNNLKLNNNVIFVESTPEVFKYYQAMDCFLFPSLYEGLGMVLIEAQMAKVPCITSSVVPKDSSISNKIQFIDLSNSPELWSDIILKEKENKEEIQYYNKEKYDIEKESKKIEDIYIRLLKEC